mmetsp:Transcript_30517/g.68431  ORF Transcript_30517/g.68431 Transcript_30517/m.68431 type:complete len:293 (+) Transcript_30517:76-954(+)
MNTPHSPHSPQLTPLAKIKKQLPRVSRPQAHHHLLPRSRRVARGRHPARGDGRVLRRARRRKDPAGHAALRRRSDSGGVSGRGRGGSLHRHGGQLHGREGPANRRSGGRALAADLPAVGPALGALRGPGRARRAHPGQGRRGGLPARDPRDARPRPRGAARRRRRPPRHPSTTPESEACGVGLGGLPLSARGVEHRLRKAHSAPRLHGAKTQRNCAQERGGGGFDEPNDDQSRAPVHGVARLVQAGSRARRVVGPRRRPPAPALLGAEASRGAPPPRPARPRPRRTRRLRPP